MGTNNFYQTIGSVTAKTTKLTQPTYSQFYESNIARAVVVIADNVYNIDSYTFRENCHGATDSASVTLVASNNPDWTVLLFRDAAANPNLDTTIYAKIYAGFPSTGDIASGADISQLELQFSGSVDQYTIKLKDDEVQFDLRSLGAPLTSNKITSPFQNHLTTDFIKAMAAKFGLTPIINIPTTSQITMQTVMQQEQIAGIHNFVIWDIMQRCAIYDDADVWVDAKGNLNYQSPYLIQNRIALPLQWGRDLLDCEIVHSPQFNKNIRVEVRSSTLKVKSSVVSRTTANADGSQTVTQYSKNTTTAPIWGSTESVTTTYTSTGSFVTTVSTSSGGSSSDTTGFENETTVEKYVFKPQGLTQAGCADLAAKLWRQISMHEYSVTLKLPASKSVLPLVDITAIIRLTGTPYAKVNTSDAGFNQSYYGQFVASDSTNSTVFGQPVVNESSIQENQGFWPRSIEHSFSTTEGWHWTIIAVNHTPPAQGA